MLILISIWYYFLSAWRKSFKISCSVGRGCAFPLFLFIYLFLAALGLHCYAWAFSSCGERGLLFVGVHRLLIAVASLVAKHGL